MRSTFVVLATAVALVAAQAPAPSISAAPGSLPLGAQCSDDNQCANGAQCYGVTSFTIRTCGSFQSACTSDNQCATNTCNQGFCNGLLPSSSMDSTETSATSTTASGPAQTSIDAAPGSLPLGAQCSSSEQCANGAQCYGVTSFTITTCGSFQSSCTSDNQCATNTCNQGFCNGPLSSSSITEAPTTTTGSSTETGLFTPTFSSVVASPSSLPLGAQCSSDEQCANGAQCYGVTSFTIRTCGSFQSACTSDNQCATNTCNQGFCNGLLPSSSMTTVVTPTGNATVSSIPSATFTGAASKMNIGIAGLVGAAFAALAL
ncbi:hypothetical protein H072_8435 [Dactylellina haptotyla CBS 200.50]|uniref:Dickkopf N-terminal cysteine-rich domain-containing protein n=1 Tax=Dactylellina haptotyla (strain CBS 200.50) TaxID=1284197 RepID=S8A4C4_DACHA|nr:hypothetical protein H072_8435 [Dactylellina haptotyla CBS 200.50]